MRLNENEKVVGKRCVLVPYKALHVLKYNNWMQDDELLQATSSERLTLEEELEMQKSWHIDPDKLTFIILDKVTYEKTGNEINAMAGDINAFLNLSDNIESKKEIELSIMLAEKKFRGQGLAQEAIALMIIFINTRLALTNFIAKIDANNALSISLFKKLYFTVENFNQVFNCYTLKFDFKRFYELLSKSHLLICEKYK